MEHRRRKSLTHWANLGFLTLEGLAIGLAAGVVICCFRLARDAAATHLSQWLSLWLEYWYIAPVWFFVLVFTARILGELVLRAPLISGSGIPQTELVVAGRLHLSRMEWLKILPAKFVACLLSTLGGLSLGREGPCIQMGAATASLLGGFWERFSFSGHIHIAAGAAAGMAAAFGSPLAGFLFVFEEMKNKFTRGGALLVACSVVSAALATRFLFGLGRIFPFSDMAAPPLSQVWILPILGLVTGVAGVLYNKALLGGKNWEALHSPLPQRWRILPPLLISFTLSFLCPSVLGGGEHLVIQASTLTIDPNSCLFTLAWLCLLKATFSVFSYTGNVPGGILMPMLCIGALLGAVCGQSLLALGLISPELWGAFLVYGMAGFFVSVVRAPLTGTALVIEMSGALSCLPGTILVAFTAFWTANALRCPPVYDSLRAAIVVQKRR